MLKNKFTIQSRILKAFALIIFVVSTLFFSVQNVFAVPINSQLDDSGEYTYTSVVEFGTFTANANMSNPAISLYWWATGSGANTGAYNLQIAPSAGGAAICGYAIEEVYLSGSRPTSKPSIPDTFTNDLAGFPTSCVLTSGVSYKFIWSNNSGGITVRVASNSAVTQPYYQLGDLTSITTRFIDYAPPAPSFLNASYTTGDETVTVADTSDLFVGQAVFSSDFANDTVISSITNSTTIEMNNPAINTAVLQPVAFLFTVDFGDPYNVGATVYVNSDDWVDGMYVDIAFTNSSVQYIGGDAISGWNSAFGGGGDNGLNTVQFPIDITDTDIDLVLSEEITFAGQGTSIADFRLVRPNDPSIGDYLGCVFAFLGGGCNYQQLFGGSVIRYHSHSFLIGERTGIDLYFGTPVTNNGDGVSAGGDNSSVNVRNNLIKQEIEACKIATFDMKDCFVKLFIPDISTLGYYWGELVDGVFSVWPFGYFTRLIVIMSDGDSVIPPPITYEFGTSSPVVLQDLTDGDPVTFQIFEHFDVLPTIEADDGSNKNIWDIIMPYWIMIVNFAVFFLILQKLNAVQLSSDYSSESTIDDSYDSYGNEYKTKVDLKNSSFGLRSDGVSISQSNVSRVSHVSKVNKKNGTSYFKHGRLKSNRKRF